MLSMPSHLSTLLAGTSANAAQVVQYLQPDPTTAGKRRLLRDLTPYMGPAVQVARDRLVEQGMASPTLATEQDVSASAWGSAEFSKWLDSDLQRTFDICTTELGGESKADHAYRVRLCKRIMAGEAIDAVSFRASGQSATLIRHLANCAHLARLWKIGRAHV